MAKITAGGYEFDYEERTGSPKEMCSGDVFRAQRVFDVPYNYRWVFIKHMLGTATLENSDKIARVIPDQYYVYYSNQQENQKSFMVATTLEGLETLGEQTQVTEIPTGTKLKISRYKQARITIGYEAVTYDVLTDAEMKGSGEETLKRFVTVFRQPTAEFLTLPQGAFRWVEYNDFGTVALDSTGSPCGLKVTGSTGRIISAQEIVLVHHKVPGVPQALNTHIGCVNDREWKELRAQKGQLLLANVELKPYRWLDNQKLFDITYKFKFFDPDPEATAKAVQSAKPDLARGHNWFLQYYPSNLCQGAATPDPETLVPRYKLITHNGLPDGKTVYAYKDMRELFKGFTEVKEGQW